MFQKIKDYIEEHHMLKKNDKVIVGISGGADSVCLLTVLMELKEVYQLSVTAVHVNHGIRGQDAMSDQRLTEQICGRHGVALKTFYYSVREMAQKEKISEEEMGRNLRYQVFQKVLIEEQADKIAVAHNQNDQSETVLLHLARGSGISGLCGIHPVRGAIIRPLLNTSRKEIEYYLEERKIPYVTDKTNFSDEYTRNKIRLSILPALEEKINPRTGEHIAKTAGMVLEAYEYIKKNGKMAKERIAVCENGKYSFDVNTFLQEEPILQKEILRCILEELTPNLKDLTKEHIAMIKNLCEKETGKGVHLPYGIRAEKRYHTLMLYRTEEKVRKKEKEVLPVLEIQILPIGKVKKEEIPKNNCTKWFDYDKIANTATLRHRQTGDYLQIDPRGNTKKINRFFIDQKVPREKRDSIFLLADGSHIIWILGYRISEAYKVDERTKNIMIVKINGGVQDVR